MDIQLFDVVRIIDNGVIGTVVDIYKRSDDVSVYIIESHKKGYVNDPDAYNGDHPLYDRIAEQLEKQ